jgi:hypothetical protein
MNNANSEMSEYMAAKSPVSAFLISMLIMEIIDGEFRRCNYKNLMPASWSNWQGIA